MTRHKEFDVRVAADVEQTIRAMARGVGGTATDARHLLAAQQRLAASGTRANGASKLRSLEIWEVRAGRCRLFFVPVPGTHWLAVGAIAVKTRRRLRMLKLESIERRVLRWRQELEETR